jgi:signal transduction histidine kinase
MPASELCAPIYTLPNAELEPAFHMLRLAAHEIKAPLTRLKGYVELLQSEALDGSLPPDMMEHTLDRMNRAVDSLTGLVKRFTDPSMSAPQHVQAHLQPLSLRRLLAEVAAHYPEVELIHSDTADVVAGDSDRLEQVLINLFENARKYSPAGGVRATLQSSGSGVLLLVRDQGIGLPPGAAETIFGLFGRAPNALHVRGQGLGLYISRHIVEQHGGKIWARSDGVGRGTTFHVWLPRPGLGSTHTELADSGDSLQ